MKIWVTPPPRFPQPPTSAFAVPAISLVNIRVAQNWHITKLEPPSPIKKRTIARLSLFCTRPIIAAGMDASMRTVPIRIRAPNLSHRGPRRNRIIAVPATDVIFEVQISLLLIPRVSCTSGRSGAIANQMRKARKKQIHDMWKARICGLSKLQSFISDARSSWSGSTLMEYVLYFLISSSSCSSSCESEPLDNIVGFTKCTLFI
mmetsp:Transcript_5310/g.6202  ORF Transcript_5310/g.6202 Transcript_5310/m.6202 type:complete len:204 (-) Transcript_5310:56-667(-)